MPVAQVWGGVATLNTLVGNVVLTSSGSTMTISLSGQNINIDLALGHSNTWTAAQIFTTIINQGGYHANITNVSSTPTNMVGTDEVVLVTTGGAAITYNLTSVAATAKGRKVVIIQIDALGGSVVIVPNGSDKIEGATSKTISAKYGKVGLVSDGVSNWYDLGTGGGI